MGPSVTIIPNVTECRLFGCVKDRVELGKTRFSAYLKFALGTLMDDKNRAEKILYDSPNVNQYSYRSDHGESMKYFYCSV